MNRLASIIILFSLAAATLAQSVPVINFREFEPELKHNNDTLYMVNFWATWCMPCVEEMPDILMFADEMRDKKFRLILVSLDNPDHLESRVYPFIAKFDIKERVVLLDDPDANSWIEKVHPDWMGSIPGTLFYSRDFRMFHGKTIDHQTLRKIVNPRLK
ncbi:MAG: redoxin family protein [Bacteroidales bacterium]|nr:redoxin family protein [Bacteroidales bacterium]